MSTRFVLSLVLTWMEEGDPDVVDADVDAASDAESDAASDTASDKAWVWLEGYEDERVLVSANGGALSMLPQSRMTSILRIMGMPGPFATYWPLRPSSGCSDNTFCGNPWLARA